ncbi:uncharacterized protein [Lolium perenne]|uniref:uncharacterized protein n=1 Tax=Lolium perenne TaxID=4522 RepID=UPI003A99E1DC
MAHRGGGMNNRGRGFPGGAGRGFEGGGRWNGAAGRGFGQGRGSNFFEGSSSGTAGDDDGARSGADLQGSGFDGVFRAGSGNRNSGGGQDRYNYAPNFNRSNDRRNFNGQGNYNNRRFNSTYVPRDANYRNSSTGTYVHASANDIVPEGLSAEQTMLVKEAAAAFAKQLAEWQPKGGQSTESAVPPSTASPAIQDPAARTDDAARRHGSGQRAETVLLSVAGISQQQVTPTAHEVTGDAQLAKKKKGSGCFRCGKPGHCLNDCNQICDCCQSPDHKSRDCPLLSAPKPAMEMYGLAHEDLMFWEFPLSGVVRPRLENTRMGRVTVSGGQLTIPEIITQLQWIVPEDNYQWDVAMVEENVYRVNFPSKMDLVRVQHFGRFNIPNSQVFMNFDFWTRTVEPSWRAEDVWVRVHDLPSPVLDDFLALWALGTLFGKTKDIDMAFTRANDVLRISITCLNSSLIPTRMDVRVHEEFYRLRFEVEGLQPILAADVPMDDVPHGDGDMEHDGPEEHQQDDVNRPDEKNDGGKDANQSGKHTTVPHNNIAVSPIQFGMAPVVHHFMESPKVIISHSIYECIKKSQCVNQLDLSVSKVQYDSVQGVFSPCFTEVLMPEAIAESDVALPADGLVISAQPVMHGCTSITAMHATSIGGEVAVHAVTDDASLAHVEKGAGVQSIDGNMMIREEQPVMSPSVTPVGVNKVFEDSASYDHSMTEVINFGGIANDSMKGLRSSARLRAQPNSDYTQMERAMMLANKRDQQQSQGDLTDSYMATKNQTLKALFERMGEKSEWKI